MNKKFIAVIVALVIIATVGVVGYRIINDKKVEEPKQETVQPKANETEKEVVIGEQKEEDLQAEARKVVEKLGNAVAAKNIDEYNKIMNEVFVDVGFYSNPDEMDSNVKEVKTKFANEKVNKSGSNFYYTADLIFEFVMKDGTTKIGEESPNTTIDFANQDGKMKILSIQTP